MTEMSENNELERLRRERDLYLQLLRLGSQEEVEPFLKEALSLITEAVGAQHGYLELDDPNSDDDDAQWYTMHGLTGGEVADIRSTISRGIVAEALAVGQTLDLPSAMLDPRFADRGSVRAGRIQAVLCAPIGADPPCGVVYLQRRDRAAAFTEDDRKCAEIFAQHLAPIASSLLIRLEARNASDPTQPFRKKLRVESVVGRSPALAQLLEQVSMVAPTDVSVLLRGDSGTGKTQIARLIHENSRRAQHPFVELNCGALPETLIESELFGAMPGSHSTATHRTQGKVAAAQHGTLLLDEIGDLTPSAQAKLLQLLQSRTYYPLGATQPESADIRVIAATNVDLEEAVAAGRFRSDLFFRLQVLPVRVPSLAERPKDVPELARYFCEEACKRHGLPRVELSTGALGAAVAAEWPGNIRELSNAIEAAAIRAGAAGSTQIEKSHLFPASSAPSDPGDEEPVTFQEATRRFQERFLSETLEKTGWNVKEAASRLDIARSHIYNLIRAFKLERD